MDEPEQWRLIVATPRLRKEGPRQVYGVFRELLARMDPPPRINLNDIWAAEAREPWRVTLVDTGLTTETGGRVRRLRRWLENEDAFCLTYGDGLGNVDITRLIEFHREHGKLATMTVVHPPGRFGVMTTERKGRYAMVRQFEEKPQTSEGWINGGFFFFKRTFFENYLSKKSDCVLEKAPLAKLAQEEELCMYKHKGFWACMDTQRDRDELNILWNNGRAPWIPQLPFLKCPLKEREEQKL